VAAHSEHEDQELADSILWFGDHSDDEDEE